MEKSVYIGACSLVLFGASLCVLISTFVLSCSRKTWLGPDQSRHINRSTLTIGMLVAVFVLNLAIEIDGGICVLLTFLRAFFSTLQTMLANREPVTFIGVGLSDGVVRFCEAYEYCVYVLAPVSSILTVLGFITDLMTPIRLRWRSLWHDTYILSPLSDRTIELAESVVREWKEGGLLKKKPSIVFTDGGWDSYPSLTGRVREAHALLTPRPVEQILQGIPLRKNICVVLDADSGASNAMRAAAIQKMRRLRQVNVGKVRVFAVTSLYGTDTAPFDYVPQLRPSVRLCRFDWTRNLVTIVLDRYPLFMRSFAPTIRSKDAERSVRRYLRWQRRMLTSGQHHVVIVGAGHVGTEFLRLALSYSRVHGVDFRFDVFDNVPDPTDPSRCMAEGVLRATAPELLDVQTLEEDECTRATVHFHLCDARSVEYARFIEAHHESVTYVFVSVGDDDECAEIALRTREFLERGIVRRCASMEASERSRTFCALDRSVIVAVIDNEEVAASLTSKNRQHRDRRIRAVGLASDMYTYRQMNIGSDRATSLEQNSSIASQMHAKYRLFAFARTQAGRNARIDRLCVDWGSSFQEVLGHHVVGGTLEAIERYNEYCETTSPFGSEGHEWLLRMEHSRWNTYMRAEGYCRASVEELGVYHVSKAGIRSPHRLDLGMMHPCLVPFDDLRKVDEAVNCLRSSAGLPILTKTFQEKNNDHLKVAQMNRRLS